MADLDVALSRIIGPGLELLPSTMDSERARLMLLAIGMQESRFEHRRQIRGPARGFWQFERAGGVQGVLRHRSTAKLAAGVCAERGVPEDATSVYNQLEHDDLLACAFARLLLWTDPQPLPAPGYASASWQYYLRTWRPGKPHRHTWDALYRQALQAVGA